MRILRWLVGSTIVSFSLFALSLHFGKVDVHLNFGAPFQKEGSLRSSTGTSQASMLFLKCAMQGGTMQGKTYSFSFDPAARTAGWADYGMPLEILYLDEQRLHTNVKLRLSGWPEHDLVSFNFNRVTLAVEGRLGRMPSSEEIAKCRAQPDGPWQLFCASPHAVGEPSEGTCKLIERGF